MRKTFVYLIAIAILGLLAYKSVYFKKLSGIKNASNARFDPADFTKKLWNEKMIVRMDSAVDLPVFIAAVNADKEAAFTKYSNALAIGNYRYALIKTEGTIVAVNADDVSIEMPVSDSVISATIATEYIYGNTVRDASALVSISEFPNTSDLNNISEEMNKIVRTTIVPEFRSRIKTGNKIRITAAVELNKEHIKWNHLELIPLRFQIMN
jgi:predicted lipoprotein